MRLGINYSLTATLPVIERLAQCGAIDYCEILIDNYLHLPIEELRRLRRVLNVPFGFHIMHSRFLERDDGELRALAERIARAADALEPLYYSDHLVRFTHRGQTLRHFAELDYARCLDSAMERVDHWQRLLGQPLHLENYPGIMDNAWQAPAFYTQLCAATGAGLLFDVSNALCAERNCGAPFAAWLPLAGRARHFHVAGFRDSIRQPPITIDSHGDPLSTETLQAIESLRPALADANATLTLERDDNIDFCAIQDDLRRLREMGP